MTNRLTDCHDKNENSYFCSLIWFLTELGYVFVQVAISIFMMGRTFSFKNVKTLIYIVRFICIRNIRRKLGLVDLLPPVALGTG